MGCFCHDKQPVLLFRLEDLLDLKPDKSNLPNLQISQHLDTLYYVLPIDTGLPDGTSSYDFMFQPPRCFIRVQAYWQRTHEMKHLSVLSFRECYSAPRQIRLRLRQPPSPRAHPSVKKIEKEDFLENFKAANRINSLDGFFHFSATSSCLMCVLFLEGCCHCCCECVCMCGGEGGLVREFILLCIGV